MKGQRWVVAAFAIVLSRLTVVAADTALTFVRAIDGREWEASLLGYHAAALVITTANGRSCMLPLAQIDWETTARRNGGPIDLLRLPEVDRSPAACETPAPSAVASDAAPVQPPVAGVTGPGANRSVPYPPADVERYRAIAVRASVRPLLDGALDDPVWHEAIPFGDFFQSERRVGEPASEPTEVRILYDADNIYFGIRCYDSSPDLVVAKNMVRDGPVESDDSITILLDPLHDHRTAYLFGTNPNGMRADANLLGSRRGDLNTDWDGVWNVASRRDSKGWTAEFEISLTTVRFRAIDTQTWGLALERRIARRNERSYWPFIPNDSTFYRPPQAGHLTGLRGIRPGASLRLKPYVSAGAGRDFAAARTDRGRDVGLDVRYWPTPTLTADFTVNTDFAQTEVDDVQINLTRFPLYYPEKRQFFLDGGRTFDFGGTGEARIFYSRRIGLSDDRQPVAVVAGGRLTGKVGRYYIGALAVRTAEEGATPSADAFVARATRDVFERSQVGAIVTERRTTNGDVNRVAGIDANFYRGDALSVQVFAAKVFDQRVGTGTFAGRASLGWNTDLWGLNFSFLDLQDNFRPGLGFVPRPGMFCYTPRVRFSPRPAVKWIRRTYFESNLGYHPTQEGILWTRTGGASFRVELENGDDISIRHSDNYERLFKPFAVRSDQSVPPGGYSFGNHGIDLSTFTGRDVQGSFSWSDGRFYDGRRTDLAASAVLRFNTHVSVAPGLSRSDVILPRGAFTATIVSTRVTYTFTPNVSVRSLTQWDNDSRSILSNVRFNYIPKPGADLYVVFTEADQVSARLQPRNRSLVVKLNYIFDF